MHQVLKTYLRRLTNLSSRNKTLFLLRLKQQEFVDLHEFDFLLNEPSFHIIEKLIREDKKIPLCDLLDSRDENTNIASQRLKKIKRSDDFVFVEQGSKDLHVGWPFVSGQFSDGTPVRCPLLLFPVTIVLEKNKWFLSLREDVSVVINPSFLLAYAHYNQVGVDETLFELTFDTRDPDSRIFRTSLYKLIKDSSIEIDFGQDFFVDKLKNFRPFRKDVFLEENKEGILKLYPEAALGIFPLSTNTIMKDYEEIIKHKTTKDLDHFFHYHQQVFGNQNSHKHIKEEETFTPFPIDIWQETAIKTVKSGQSLVVQGPPGTGKSQMICNLVADYMARGKSILVVCQKRVALDVVYDRMRSLGYEKFIGLVHDHRQDRKEIFAQLAKQIDSLYEYQLLNNGLDAINLERQFLTNSHRIDQIVEELNEYKEALFNEEESGMSVKQLYLISNPHEELIDLKQKYKYFRMSDISQVLKLLKVHFNYKFTINIEGAFWTQRKSFSTIGLSDLKIIKKRINEVSEVKTSQKERSLALTGYELSFRDFESIYNQSKIISSILNKLKQKSVYTNFCDLIKEGLDEPLLKSLEDHIGRVMDCFKGDGPESSIDIQDIGKFQLALKRGADSKSSPISYLKWRFFSKEKMWVKRVLVANDLQNKHDSLGKLMYKIDNRLNLQHNRKLLEENFPFLERFPPTINRISWDEWSKDLLLAIQFLRQYRAVKKFTKIFKPDPDNFERFERKINGLLTISYEIPNKMASWEQYLSKHQINMLIDGEYSVQQACDELERDYDDIQDFDKIVSEYDPEQLILVEKLEDYFEKESLHDSDASVSDKIDKILKVFQNSIVLAWIEHMEIKYPVLRMITSKKFQLIEQELQNAIEEKNKLAKDIVLLNIREKTYNDAKYNRLKNMVSYRNLNHQVNKKRRVWPLRKLMETFNEEIFNLMPCWLASPESVSSIFSMDVRFDLVIFDEASQCFSEKGIPAMYRGRQLVITGDSKQLRPNSLYSIRYQEEEEGEDEEVALEVDSLLELSSQYLKQFQLRGHYRSKHPALIQFSNQNFYDGNLQVLPDYEEFVNNQDRLQYVKVDGIWENRRNEVEATKVLDLVKKISQEKPNKSIGVVTFNITQKDYLEDLFDLQQSTEKWVPPKNLFIKNIENVQGDERDVIIFSVGYAPNLLGKMRMQFGSLNMQGGENRLNVAVSRAREKVYVVASIFPDQLKTKNARFEGPRLLKKYLEFVYTYPEYKNEQPITPHVKNKDSEYYDWYLKDLVKQSGNNISASLLIDEHFPFADLTMHLQTGKKGLIFTDDDHYKNAITMKSPHAYIPIRLKERAWPYLSLSSRQYWKNRREFNESLRRFIYSTNDY